MESNTTAAINMSMTQNPTKFLENGTMLGALTNCSNSMPNVKVAEKQMVIPEIVISASYSTNSLNQSQYMINTVESNEEIAVESTALLAAAQSDVEALPSDEFEQFVLNRTTSDSNILDSSIYSELQFSPSNDGNSSGSGGPTAQLPTTQSSTASSHAVDLLNTSTCSRDSRQAKRTRRKHKSKSKCGTTPPQRATPVMGTSYPPQYTAIFLDPHHHSGTANAIGQIANAAAPSAFINGPVTDAAYLQQQFQYFQQRPMMTSLNQHHRSLLDPTASHSGIHAANDSNSSQNASSTITTSTSAVNPATRLNMRKWFSRPSLPFVIGILALGGVACTLGGIVLGSTGLIEHSTQYLSAALLMIGIGVSLLVISGAIWRLSLPDDTDDCPCYRHMETCRNCNSPYCNNRLLPGSYLYPEFQHRPPPPSYLTSLNECAAMSLLFHPATQQAAYNTLRMNTPPPLYRSTNSLAVFMPNGNSNNGQPNNSISTGNAINPTTIPVLPNAGSILQDHNALTMSVVMENLQAQTQAVTKEFNYLELD
ncbi:uncharacterized protein LOC119686168 [Teleopsis dalmanni]|uniref:uncharacterized protein LOC119686168 n=1 Tax=Teleopsis dalmanni TaxID=139649 RepID=UPI0018CEFA6E|nr:uncharacterized protein LOC119686168 [Teleopsis dalmanni]